MSLITRCPACETLFKVVPDQLRISDGWVRCGQCDEIFDASFHLLPAVPDTRSFVPALQDMAAVHEDAASSTALHADAPHSPSVDRDTPGGSCLEEVPLPMAPVLDDCADEGAGVPALAAMEDEPAGQRALIPESTGLQDATPTEDDLVHVPPVEQAIEPDLVVPVDFERIDPEPPVSDISFLQGRKKNVFWHRASMQVFLMALSLLLLLGLIGQIVFRERDRIVALEPRFKPWLQAICEPLHCTVSPLRQIESIQIDSASFTRIRGDSYRLNFTVKSTAKNALAIPSVELTLTDSLDQPVIRRVFSPGELGVKSEVLAAGAEWPASVAIAVKATGAAERVAGYRVLAFYP